MKSLRALYLTNRLFTVIGIIAFVFIFGFLFSSVLFIAKILFYTLLVLFIADVTLLYSSVSGVKARRFVADKLSNGDFNEIRVYIENHYPFNIGVNLIDEVPFQFQRRDLNYHIELKPNQKKTVKYQVRPVKRGEYSFGLINIFCKTTLGLVSRRYKLGTASMVPVYPSFIQMRKYELLAISNKLTEFGIKKIRRIGHNMEFDQIKEYVTGDDFRTINWKATARKATLMVNSYQDEKSQQIYSVIDKGRIMQMPFAEMTLLDYAINAALAISNIAIKKDDKAGLITFQHKLGTLIPASRRNKQMHIIQEALYNQKTAFKETDFSNLFANIQHKLSQRSLLLLFTNFESAISMRRQLPYLHRLAKNHLVVLVFFENTELTELLQSKPNDVRGIYHKTIAEKLAFEKKLMVHELVANGIHAVLTPPDQLTINTINKYLELKARGLI